MNIKNIGMNTFTSRSKRQATSNIVTKGFGFSWLKQAFVLLALLMVSSGVWGQVVGDYKPRASARWDATNTWSVYNGTAWVNASDYPGQNTGAGTVFITTGYTVEIRATPANSIGKLSIEGGSLTKRDNNTAYSLSIAGDFNITSGTLTFAQTNNSAALTITVGGNFNMSGGTITETSSNAAGVGNFIFNKLGTQTYSKTSGTISNTINFTVNSGSNLDLGTSVLDGSGGTFNLNSGATLTTAHTQGISSTAATGSIQVTGTKTYSSGASFVYNGVATQVTGNGLTQNTPANLTINNSAGVTLSAATTISGLLTMTSGALNMANTNLTVGSLTGVSNISNSSGTPTSVTLSVGSDGSSPAAYSGIVSNGTATSVAISKSGTGALTLSGANTYTGVTNITAGTMKLGASTSVLGTIAGITTVSSGAVLDLNGFTLSTAEPLTLNGAGLTALPAGALTNNGVNASYSGAITLGAASTITSTISGTLTCSGTVGTGAFALTLNGASGSNGIMSGIISTPTSVVKNGTGTWILSGANTYTGATNITAGTLKLGASTSALGTVAGITTVSSGAVLDLNGYTLSTAEPITLNGIGLTALAAGALTNSGADASYSGPITLGSVSTITSTTSGTLTCSGTVGTGAFALTLDGASGSSGTMSGIISTPTSVVKNGAGTWTLSGANTYTGATNITAGTLKLGASTSALGTIAGITTVSSGAVLDLNGFTLSTSEPLTLNGAGLTALPAGALTNSGANTSYSGAITLGSAGAIGTTGDITLGSNGILGTQDLTKVGAGTLSLGSGTATLNSLIVSAGSVVSTSGNLNVAGSFTNNGAFTHNSGTVIFTGSTAGAINGTTSTVFNNLTVNKTVNGVTLGVATSIASTLTLSGMNLSLGNYDLTIGTIATIAGSFDGTKMIETNGAGNLVKQSSTTVGLNITYPVGVGSLYNPMILSSLTGSVVGTGSVSVRAVSGLAPNTSSTDLKKHWIVSSTNLTLTSTNISFAYINPTDVGGTQGEYTLRYSTTPAVVWSAPNTPSASGVNPMTTTSSTVLDGTWTAREVNQTWYSMRSGNWNDPTIWTLDPAGSLFNNPLNTYPQLVSDNVVVKNGKNVVVNVSNLTCKDLTVQGSLDFASTTGHTFATINGNGRILLSSNNWPAGNATDFITPGQGEGTTVFYGNSFSLTSARTFFNMEVMMTAGQTLTLMSDFTLNNNLEVKTGTFKINDDASTVKKTLTINNDVTVSLNASFTVGAGDVTGVAFDSYHDVICLGNFTNEGTVQFTNQAQPTYNAFPANGGINLIFQGASDDLFTCNNTTNLYRMVVNKGTDQTYVLKLDVSADKNFRLYGANNTGSADSKALYIQNGTLRLTGTMFIPSLTEDGADYYIPATSCLWMDSPGVRVNTTATSNAETTINGITSTGVVTTATGSQSFSIYGKFRITDGLLKTNSHGFVVWAGFNAIIQIDGGNIETPGLRSASGSTGKYSYIQTGGTVKMSGDIGSDGLEDQSATFSLKGADNVFIMTGGVLEIQDANTVTAATRDRAFEVYSDLGNFNVTGGTLRINNLDADGGNNFYIYSSAPIGNLEITTQTTNIANVVLESGLTVLNNITIGNYGTLDVTTTPYNLLIGGNLTTGATSSTYNARTNTTTFNGAKNSIITNASALTLNKVVINKSGHTTPGSFYEVSASGSAQLNLASDLTITLGTFNTGSTSPNVAGNIAITSGNIISTVAGLPSIGKIVLNSTTATQTLSGSGLNFGSITLNNTNFGAKLLSDVVVKDLAFNAAGTAKVNIGVYNLTVSGAITNTDATNRWIYGAGNASDGGLSLYVSANGAITYPVGYNSTMYTEAKMTVSGYSDDGYVTIVPVKSKLATAILNTDQLSLYWKVHQTGFGTKPNVAYSFIYNTGDIVTGVETNYIAGKVLDESPYTRSPQTYPGASIGSVTTGTNTIAFNAVTIENANYTAGVDACFTGTVVHYYSKGGDWNTAATWDKNSKGSATHEVPLAGSIVHIYNTATASSGRVNCTISAIPNAPAEIIFEHDYTTYPVPNSETVPRLQFWAGSSGANNLGRVTGTGMVSVDAPSAIGIVLNGDFGDFGTNSDSYYLYFGGAATLTTIPTPIPNLIFEGTAKNINQAITVNSDFIIQGGTTITPYQNVDIKRDLSVGMWDGGTLQFRGSGTPITMTVGRNIDFTKDPLGTLGTRTIVCEATATDIAHRLIVKGNIIHGSVNSSTFDLYNGATNRNRVVLELAGTGVHNYSRTSTAVPDFYQIVMNKGVDQTSSFTFNQHFTIYTGGNNGATKSITMQNGTLVFNSANFSAFNLTSGAANFAIPGTSALELTLGTFTANGTSGIDLDGKLKINGATASLDMSGGDNPIVFGAGGSSTIDVSAGTLIVGGQIRRATNSDVGTLKYYQSGGNVYVGRTTTGATTRGTFEVLGTGSVLSITGGDLYIERSASVSVPALYLMPETTTLASANTMHIGSASVGSQTIGIYSTPSLQNLDVLNSSTAKLMTVPLNLSGNLSISSGTFNANALALNIGGNFVNNATFTHGNNTTTFNGSIAQAISGTTATTFYKLTKTTSNTLTTQTAITVANDLTLSSGVIADNGNTITVKGDVTVNGTHQYGAAGKGILLDNGTVSQNLLGNGTIGMLTINNSKGVDVAIGNLLTISNNLRLESGVFNIDKNLLTLGVNAQIIAGNAFSSSNMIQTNESFTDNGVKKIFPSGASGLFTYPVGSGGKYAPVMFTVTGNGNSTGSITIKPAAEYHPSVLDPTNVLNYYWTVVSSGISGFSATANLNYDQTDVRLTGANTEADYIAARLLSDGLGQWNKFDVTTVNEATNQIQFSYSAVGDAEISGDYTAGINSAIPNKVPRFESTKNGDWTDVSVWSLIDPVTSIPGAAGVGIPVGGPRGSIATVKHVVTSTGNGLSSYNTIISGTTANLITGSTYNHRLGIVSGTGTLTCSVGDLPAADYSLFFATTGGTLEYNGASSIDILTDLPTINNLKLSGTGTRILPNIDIQLLGSLTIAGPIVNNDTYDKAISIKGNITFDSGTFSAGNLASSKLIMNGSSVQTVSGLSSFTSATNDLNHFEINNSVGVVLSKPVDVLGNLTLTNGYLTTTTTNILKMTTASSTASAGSSTAFVDGPMMKQMTAGGNFNFPIGKSGRLGTIDITSVSQSGLWYAEYFNNSANNQSLTTSNVTAPVAIVSQGEYWNILAPAAATAGVKLYWDASSGVDPSSSDMRGVQWITNSWNEVALGTKTGTSAGGSAPTSSVVSFNANAGGNYITFGSITTPAYTWTGSVNTDWFTAGNWTGGVPTGSSNTTIASTTNKPVVSGSTVAQTNNLTLQTGATLTINAGGKMTVNGNLSIADANSLIVKNTPASMASLITNGTISGTARIETTMPLGNRYWYYGFSVNGAGVTSGVWNATDIVNTWAYKANTTAYVRFTDNVTPLGSNPHSGLLNGYSVKLLGTGNTTLVVQGSLNNGNLSTTLPNNSWNLMCNPYPSSLDMSIVYANNVADYGTGKVDPMMWVPTNESGSTVQRTYNFATGIGTNGGTKILPPTQGFWLRNTNTVAQNFTVNQAARLHSATALKSLSTPIEEDLFRFELVGATMSDEMVVGFRDIGSVGVTMYDSEKRLNSGTSSCNIYSVKATKGLAVNLLPLMGVDTVVVPLSVNAGTAAAGNYSVRATNLATFDSSIDVYFVDILNDITINLRQVNVVSLNLSAGTVNNRYVLKFAPSSTGVPTVLPDFTDASADNDVEITQQGNDVLVTIPGNVEPTAVIELYGIEGQLIRVKKQLEKVTRIHLPNDNNIYVVRVTNNGKVKSAKVVSMGR